jgi:hypothetical protein
VLKRRRSPTKLITVIAPLQGRYIGDSVVAGLGPFARRGKREEQLFLAELARVRGSGALGDSGRLRELFDYLAARGPGRPPAPQADIADSVFGQPDTEGDDATVRVYVHRCASGSTSSMLAQATARAARGWSCRPERYALRLADARSVPRCRPPPPTAASGGRRPRARRRARRDLPARPGACRARDAPPANAFWQPFLESDRPIVVVVGDYYMFGEIDPVEPEQSRLIRDFRVDSPMDLAGLQEAEPERYGNAEDVGLTYLPLSTAYGLREILPILARGGATSRVVAAPSSRRHHPRGQHRLRRPDRRARAARGHDFNGSGFALGETYDELIDTALAQDLHQRRGAPPRLAGVLPRLRLRRPLPRLRRLARRCRRRRARDRAAGPRADPRRRGPARTARGPRRGDGGHGSAVPGHRPAGRRLSTLLVARARR